MTGTAFVLLPVDFDSTGIAVDSEFLLETEKDFTLEEVKDAFSIDGEPDPVIEELDPNFSALNFQDLFWRTPSTPSE